MTYPFKSLNFRKIDTLTKRKHISNPSRSLPFKSLLFHFEFHIRDSSSSKWLPFFFPPFPFIQTHSKYKNCSRIMVYLTLIIQINFEFLSEEMFSRGCGIGEIWGWWLQERNKKVVISDGVCQRWGCYMRGSDIFFKKNYGHLLNYSFIY